MAFGHELLLKGTLALSSRLGSCFNSLLMRSGVGDIMIAGTTSSWRRKLLIHRQFSRRLHGLQLTARHVLA